MALADHRLLKQIVRASKTAATLRSIHAHKLHRYLSRVTHQIVRNAAEPNQLVQLVFPGGFRELARDLGETSNKAQTKIKQIVLLMDAIRWEVPSIEHDERLLTYKTTRGGVLTLTPSEPFYPHFVHQFKDATSRAERRAVQLVPVVDTPPTVGRANDWGSQAALQDQLLIELVRRPVEVRDTGGVLLSEEWWNETAETSGMPVRLVSRVRDRWLNDGDDGPAMLERIDADRYHLANHAPWAVARNWIDVGAKVRADASQGTPPPRKRKNYKPKS